MVQTKKENVAFLIGQRGESIYYCIKLLEQGCLRHYGKLAAGQPSSIQDNVFIGFNFYAMLLIQQSINIINEQKDGPIYQWYRKIKLKQSSPEVGPYLNIKLIIGLFAIIIKKKTRIWIFVGVITFFWRVAFSCRNL